MLVEWIRHSFWLSHSIDGSLVVSADGPVGTGRLVEKDAIVIKAAAISISTTMSWTRQEDAFVFGSMTVEGSRIDSDGISIPPESLLRTLVDGRD